MLKMITIGHYIGCPILKVEMEIRNISLVKHFHKKCFRPKLFGSKENIRRYH